ncbi:MAG TPA: type II toxin-antitoxin system PemK/MazF family toxin [Solirubrobacteraceae bacterium]|nr:type II toxin-antitoxin system PemK/MazF family toxin [Solirubrobacteraceae bacterium]HLM85285.1 type II toxin-antitoxin system PemK/MazF family toxin [Solirubrobacteraceae bacterium]
MIARGEVWDADLGPIVRPVVIATRETAIPVLARLSCVVVTSTVRGHVAEVELTRSHGVREPSVANCDWLVNVAKDRLVRRRGSLDPVTIRRLNTALVLALGLDV